MRVLLDECLPRRLKRELVGHDARTAPEMGWASKRNGELLALAAAEFDVFLTVDRNLSYQQDVSAFDIAVVVLVARSNRSTTSPRLASQVLEVIATAKRGKNYGCGAVTAKPVRGRRHWRVWRSDRRYGRHDVTSQTATTWIKRSARRSSPSGNASSRNSISVTGRR